MILANVCDKSSVPLPPLKREYPDAPLVGVGAVVIEEDRVLLIKRGQPPLAGQWSIPGGLLELGETVRAAAVREAFEETGLVVEVSELLGVFDRILPDADGRTQYHYVLVDFLCRRVSGEIRAGGDAAEARWLQGDELLRLALAKDTAEVIQLGFAHASVGLKNRYTCAQGDQ